MIKVKGLKKYYGRFPALKGIDIHVRSGEIFGFLGPNGAGKTTTLEILEGLRKHSGGEFWLFNQKIENKLPRKIKEKMGVILQESSFVDHLRVREILELFASFFEHSVSVEDILVMSQLKEKSETFVENLSGGQKKRLTIGVSMINNPELIFLDEPTTGLDPQSRESIWVLIENLRKEGKTIFLTTHYMEEAQRLCDRVAIIDMGKIIEEGSPRELINKYGGNSEVDFECITEPEEKVIGQLDEAISKVDDHYRIETSDLTKTLEKLVKWSEKYEIKLANIFLVEPDLEDVFLSLTGRELRE
ncbi:MAG: ABC transporter ATP-binding protein [Kosmotoga sp.]|nr:MAG: ABC transporter ATP-binding protein [Kosmotoga sp.]